VNFVAAKWTCTNCNGQENDDCALCKEIDEEKTTREKSWSEIEGCKNPLKEFVRWILTAFNKDVPTLAWAHAGGHYVYNLI
jgi:hypothetical protein